jgi:hypothetical protein
MLTAMTDIEFKQLSLLRLKESKALFRNRFYDGACYLAGYSLELALKAVICRKSDMPDFFDQIKGESSRAFKIHNLEELIILAGLRPKFEHHANSNIDFKNNWSHIRTTINWSEQLRYQVGKNQTDAQLMLTAISNNQNGLLPWIKKHW